jgi:hypothetical protein
MLLKNVKTNAQKFETSQEKLSTLSKIHNKHAVRCHARYARLAPLI